MNELMILLAGLFIGTIGTLGVLRFYRWFSELKREVQYLYDKRRYLITENNLMTEFLFWKNEQKKET